MGRARALGIAAGVSSAVLDGLAVAGWLAAAQHDGDVPRRRRVRRRLTAAFAAQALLVELVWERSGPDLQAGAIDARTTQQTLATACVASVVLLPLDRRVPRALAARGVQRPHLVYGAVVGLAYAACTLPIWLADTRRRLVRIQQADEALAALRDEDGAWDEVWDGAWEDDCPCCGPSADEVPD